MTKEEILKEEELSVEIEESKELNELEGKLEQEKDNFRKELSKYIGKEATLDNTLSIQAKVDRLKEKLDFMEGKLSFEDDELPERLSSLKNIKLDEEGKQDILDMIEQFEASLLMTDLFEIKFSKLDPSPSKLDKLNKKLNTLIQQKRMDNAENAPDRFQYINLNEVYEALLMCLSDTNFKNKKFIYRFTCSLGSYMVQNYKKYPYYIKAISENIVFAGKYGNELSQNEEYIKVLNKLLTKAQ